MWLCCLLITFTNSLDPDQDEQYVSKQFDTLKELMKEWIEKVSFEKNQLMTTKPWKITQKTKSLPI